MKKLPLDEVEELLRTVPGWSLADGKLFREFTFAGFSEAFGFMTAMAIAAESMDHHPEWFNVHKNVKVWLNSHEVDGISSSDFELASKMNAFFSGMVQQQK